jgi:hypothetical protein
MYNRVIPVIPFALLLMTDPALDNGTSCDFIGRGERLKIITLTFNHYTVKGARGKISFDSLNVKYASKLSCYASPEAYLSHLTSKITNTLFIFLSDKYASGDHWIVVKHICQFVSQMILYLGPLLQCIITDYNNITIFFCPLYCTSGGNTNNKTNDDMSKRKKSGKPPRQFSLPPPAQGQAMGKH